MDNVIGLDVGYGHVKTVSSGGNHSFPSVVGTYETGLMEDAAPLRSVSVVDGERFLVGEDALKHSARVFQTRERDWFESPAYKALASFAISRCGGNGNSPVVLVTGLPVGFYKKDKERLRAMLVSLLAVNRRNGLAIKILPQPMGTFFDLLFDGLGGLAMPEMTSQRIGILDIGFYTTDAVTVGDLEIVDKQVAGFELGVSGALGQIAKAINDRFGIDADLHKVEQAVRAGSIKVFGVEEQIADITAPILRGLAAEIAAKAHTLWKTGADLDRVILAGGGSELLRYHLADVFPHALVAGNAQFSNAAGFFKYGCRNGR